MYCNQNISVDVLNPDSPISAVDMILTYDTGEIESEVFNVTSTEYNDPIFNQYVYNTDIGSDTWKFGGTRLVDWAQSFSIKHLGNFLFKNKNLVTSVSLGFHALPGQTAGDSNLAYQGNDQLEVPGGVGSATFNFITGPCSPDTKAPYLP